MKNLFEAPKMNVTTFDVENVVTASGGEKAESVAETKLSEAATTKGITLTGETLKFTF